MREADKYLGQIIGAVKINKSFVHHDRGYECAAWWENQQVELGIYPVYLHRENHSGYRLHVVAKLSAKVVEDFFPAMFGGVVVSDKPYQQKHTGESRVVTLAASFAKATKAYGTIPTFDVCWYLHPSWWRLYLQECGAELKQCIARLPERWNAYTAGQEDQYQSNIGMVASYGGWIQDWARDIQEIQRAQASLLDPMFSQLKLANTAWVQEASFKIETLPEE